MAHISLGLPPVADAVPEQSDVLVNFTVIGVDAANQGADVELADLDAIWDVMDTVIAKDGILIDGLIPSRDGAAAGSVAVAITSFAVAEEYPGKTAIGCKPDGAGGFTYDEFDVTKSGAVLNSNGRHYLNAGDTYAADCGRETFDGLLQKECGAVKVKVCLSYTPDAVEDPCGWVNFSTPLLSTSAEVVTVTADTNTLILGAFVDGIPPAATETITYVIGGVTVTGTASTILAAAIAAAPALAGIGMTNPDGSDLTAAEITYSSGALSIIYSKNDPSANGGVVNAAINDVIDSTVTIADGFTTSTSAAQQRRFPFHLFDNSARNAWFIAGSPNTYSQQFPIGGPVSNTDASTYLVSSGFHQHLWGNGSAESWIGESFQIVSAKLVGVATPITVLGSVEVAVGGAGGINAIRQFQLMVAAYVGDTLTYNGFNQGPTFGLVNLTDYAFGHGAFEMATEVETVTYRYLSGAMAGQEVTISFTQNYR